MRKREKTWKEKHEKERGSGLIQTLGYFFVLAVLFFTLASIGAIMQAKHHAQAGADLGAIAGAQAINRGETREYACTYAGIIARDNKAEMLSCEIVGESVTLYVQSQPAVASIPAVRAQAVAAPEKQY